MGNVVSEQGDDEFLEEGFDLDSPEADKQINFGTAEPNCQPNHTKEEASKDDESMEVAMDDAALQAITDSQAEEDDLGVLSPKHRRDSSGEGGAEHRGKRQHLTQREKEKKMSYIQMAKMGYQELVNAIIRPPRADYKVRMKLVYLKLSRVNRGARRRTWNIHAIHSISLPTY